MHLMLPSGSTMHDSALDEVKLCSGAWKRGHDSHVGMFSLCDLRFYPIKRNSTTRLLQSQISVAYTKRGKRGICWVSSYIYALYITAARIFKLSFEASGNDINLNCIVSKQIAELICIKQMNE